MVPAPAPDKYTGSEFVVRTTRAPGKNEAGSGNPALGPNPLIRRSFARLRRALGTRKSAPAPLQLKYPGRSGCGSGQNVPDRWSPALRLPAFQIISQPFDCFTMRRFVRHDL